MQRPGPPTPPDLRLRIRGALLGTLLGDAFGAPFEMSLPGDELTRAVLERDGAVRPWGYTDDAEMTISLAESLVERRGFEPAHALDALANRSEPARGYGSGTLRVFAAFRAGAGVDAAASAAREGGSAGNGAAVRVAGISALFHRDAGALAAAAATSARLTHLAPEGIAAAVVQASALGALLREVPPEDLLPLLIALPDAALLRAKLDRIGDLLAATAPPAEAARALGTSPLAAESVPFALFSFLRGPARHESLMDAVASGGDTDSIGALTAALLGAAKGPAVFPRLWAHNLEDGPRGREHLLSLADELYEIILE